MLIILSTVVLATPFLTIVGALVLVTVLFLFGIFLGIMLSRRSNK